MASHSIKTVTFYTRLLWLPFGQHALYTQPKARLQYLSATGAQVKNQFFASLQRFQNRPAFKGWRFLENEIRTPEGGFLFGRATDAGGNIEGLHSRLDSIAGILCDETKSIPEDVLDALDRCRVGHRLYMSSTGPAFGGFYRIMTADSHRLRTFRVTSAMCPHVNPAEIEEDRQNLKDSVFRIKHSAEFLYDAGDSIISLESVRALVANPPPFVLGPKTAFVDFAGAGDETALGLCEGNRVWIEDSWRSRDTMNSVGKLRHHFARLGLKASHVGGDQGFGYQLMDRLDELGFRMHRVSNGAAAEKDEIYFNLAAESWSTVGELIERKLIILPNNDEKLISQLCSRRKLYDSRGRIRLESKEDLAKRGIESPDRAEGLIGSIMVRLMHDPFAFDKAAAQRRSKQWDLALASQSKGGVEYGNGMDWAEAWNGGSGSSECRF
jgi:hypothetical protein